MSAKWIAAILLLGAGCARADVLAESFQEALEDVPPPMLDVLPLDVELSSFEPNVTLGACGTTPEASTWKYRHHWVEECFAMYTRKPWAWELPYFKDCRHGDEHCWKRKCFKKGDLNLRYTAENIHGPGPAVATLLQPKAKRHVRLAIPVNFVESIQDLKETCQAEKAKALIARLVQVGVKDFRLNPGAIGNMWFGFHLRPPASVGWLHLQYGTGKFEDFPKSIVASWGHNPWSVDAHKVAEELFHKIPHRHHLGSTMEADDLPPVDETFFDEDDVHFYDGEEDDTQMEDVPPPSFGAETLEEWDQQADILV